MENGSLKRFVFILNERNTTDMHKKGLIFFTPTEELNGSNIFARLSNNFRIIQPFLDMIDTEFISSMNKNVCNVALYVDPKKEINSEGQIQDSIGNQDAGGNP